MAEFQLKVVNAKGVVIASTYLFASERAELVQEIEQAATDVYAELNDWLDNIDDDEF